MKPEDPSRQLTDLNTYLGMLREIREGVDRRAASSATALTYKVTQLKNGFMCGTLTYTEMKSDLEVIQPQINSLYATHTQAQRMYA